MRAAAIVALACAACASSRVTSDVDAGGDDEPDAADLDAADLDAADLDAAIDAPPPPIDAAIDAPPPLDAAIDAPPPIDAAIPVDAAIPIDAPMCTPTWHSILVNGGFDDGITPWTQTATIIRTSAEMPFAVHGGTHAAEFGASNNANDVLVQTVAIPAGATALRVRGYECHVTEDPISDTDSFMVTLETPGGNVLETLRSITNSDIAPICIWLPFTWNANAGHPGETVVLKLRGRTNFAFLTRFIVDTMALEWLGCP